MSYISTEDVKAIRQAIRKEFPKPYKFSVRRAHCSSVYITLVEGPLDIEFTKEEKYLQLNEYYPEWYDKERYKGLGEIVRKILEICESVRHNYNANAGDPYADYPAWNYFKHIQVGDWDKPYKYIPETKTSIIKRIAKEKGIECMCIKMSQ